MKKNHISVCFFAKTTHDERQTMNWQVYSSGCGKNPETALPGLETSDISGTVVKWGG